MQLPPLVMPAFPHIHASFLINAPVLLVILFLFFIIYSIITGVLLYHWSAYGMRNAGIIAAESLFLLVSFSLFTVSGLAIYYF